MNIPNILTTIRFILIPIYVLIFFSYMEYSVIYATCIFILAGITDVLDGYIARKYDMITKWGTILDPLADKLTLITVIVCLYIKNYLPFWVLVFIVIKELLMIFGGFFLFCHMDKTVIPANKYGKLSTLTFYIVIFIIAFDISKNLNYFIITIAVLIALFAFINYFIGFKKINQNKHQNIDKE
ncbi:CDP-diacylglycerol--glycerol-3-phosphate 3-phosphatidyltransferase [Abyssisolibacter fermentans]|uniref:CDP-diacylglycerol--glycerol-3-phosphate 3-phosphatidyltransferase n=1 Tax=Abyssisolibacter fermentans TaxID=1766203 RepID=UPI00082DB597|nr:CDP-diacylglycerol--glycerol-3-phosphate 3-phosphatidyltransferase [Abyssisolibacter fermentans]